MEMRIYIQVCYKPYKQFKSYTMRQVIIMFI